MSLSSIQDIPELYQGLFWNTSQLQDRWPAFYDPVDKQDYDTGKWAVTCDFQQCGILTNVDSDEPVQLPLNLRIPNRIQ